MLMLRTFPLIFCCSNSVLCIFLLSSIVRSQSHVIILHSQSRPTMASFVRCSSVPSGWSRDKTGTPNCHQFAAGQSRNNGAADHTVTARLHDVTNYVIARFVRAPQTDRNRFLRSFHRGVFLTQRTHFASSLTKTIAETAIAPGRKK